MEPESVSDVYADFCITVTATRNDRNAWIASILVKRDDQVAIDSWPERVQPEWTTADEALRDGIECARRTIRQRFPTQDSESWVSRRERATQWFIDEENHASGDRRPAG